MPEKVRLHKFLASCGIASRRKAEKLILAGRVKVNGELINELGSKVNPLLDKVSVNNKEIRPHALGVMLLNKPRGVVSTLSDPEGRKSIAQYLTKHFKSYFPVGRLDTDSSGLIILTNDGELSEKLLHPRYQLKRIYLCEVSGSVSEELLAKLRRGVNLRDGLARALVRIYHQTENGTLLEVTIREGRNRIVRRIFEKVGHPVLTLRRIAHGPFRLGTLRPGEVRKLSQKEYVRLREKILDVN